MWSDVWSVIWRDIRLYRAQFEDPRRLILGVAASLAFLVGAELVFEVHRTIQHAHPLLLIWVWCWLPLGTAVTLTTDAIAGERERHTLESLLATRLPTRAVLIGKILSITFQSWLSALMIATGALVALNLTTLWSGVFVTLPWSVLVIGPIASFALTLLGTLTAMLFSMDAPTVRQANFRILIVTSMLPVLLIVPLLSVLAIAAMVIAIVVELTGIEAPTTSDLNSPLVIAGAVALSITALLFMTALVYIVTDFRFSRERLLRARSGIPASEPETVERTPVQRLTPRFAGGLSPLAPPARLTVIEREPAWRTVLLDAGVVAWKELTEAKGLVREWRGWLVVIGLVIASMVVQMSAIGSWYWAQDEDVSIVFWLAMAATLPLFIAQRSADAIAGERERHTGEILFTTRLSHTGILVGKLAVVALLPWSVALVIPIVGLLTTNLIHAGSGPFWYPPEVLAAGVGFTLGVALLFSSGGLLISLTAPTVQHAARRMSWFLMPILIAPGLLLRSASMPDMLDQDGEFGGSGALGIVSTGELAIYVLLALPLLVGVSAMLVLALVRRFQRGVTVFD